MLAAGTAAGVACWLMFRPSGWCASLPEPDLEQLDAMLTLEGRLRLPLGALDERQLPAGQWSNWRMITQALGPLSLSAPSIRLGTGYGAGAAQQRVGRHGHDAAQLALGSEAVAPHLTDLLAGGVTVQAGGGGLVAHALDSGVA